jgi:hypothetical protein
MVYEKAMRVLSGPNENNASMEVGNVGESPMPYAFLVNGLDRVLVGTKSGSTFRDWLPYDKNRAAELYTRIAKSQNVKATKVKVKLNKAADSANPLHRLEPNLFDFSGANKNTIRFQFK